MESIAMELDDKQLAECLLGTWVSDPASNSSPASTTTYNSDGTGTEVLHWEDNPDREDVEIRTAWSVRDGILHIESVASSKPNLVPNGLKLSDRIESATTDRLVFVTHGGYEPNWEEKRVMIRKV